MCGLEQDFDLAKRTGGLVPCQRATRGRPRGGVASNRPGRLAFKIKKTEQRPGVRPRRVWGDSMNLYIEADKKPCGHGGGQPSLAAP